MHRFFAASRAGAIRSLSFAFAVLVTALPLSGQQAAPILPRPQTGQIVESAPPVKRFPKDLVRNFAALWSSDNVLPLFAGAAVTTAAIPADDAVTNFFEGTSRWQGFDGLGKQIGKSQLLGPAIGLSFLASRVTENGDFQKFTYSLAQGFIINNTLTGGLKVITGRERPDRASRSAFPSGHTSNSFMWATVVSRHHGWKMGAPAYVLAAYVGASRLKSRKHHLTDVLAGATVGYIVGRTVTRDHAKQKDRRIRWGVSVPPGGGAALSIGIRAW